VKGVIATTLVDMGDPRTFIRVARWPWLAALSLVGFALFPWLLDRLALPLNWLAPMKSMTSSPPLQAYFEDDPGLGHARIPARFFRTLHAQKLGRVTLGCPLLLVHPGADAWTPTALSLEVYHRIDGEKTFIELANGSHLPLEAPAADQLQSAVQAFLDRVAQAEAGGPACA
jgi:alpha-beta hydrolase superfamily lysophospholipase